MKNILLLLTLIGITFSLSAQEGNQQPSAGQVLSSHYARTYQLALRYNDYAVAKDALYNLFVENPNNDSILYSLSLLYLQSQQYASAALTAQDITTAKPNHTGALEILAVSYENLGVKDKALETYESLYLKSDNIQTLYKIAFLQFELDRLNESKTNVDILLSKEELKEAKAVFNNAENQPQEYPIKVALLNLKGMISKAQGDKPGAKKLFEEALKIAPDFVLAKENITNLDK